MEELGRRELEKHEADAECPQEMVKCDFEPVGCKAEFPRQDTKSHLSQSRHYHMRLLCEDYVHFRQASTHSMEQFSSLLDNISNHTMMMHGAHHNKSLLFES